MRQQIWVASVNCLELSADGHFAWDVRWQGLKPNLLQFVYGPTKSRALIQNQSSASQTVSVVSNRGHPRMFKKPYSMLHLQPSPNKRTGHS
jgi:hypothetical protein